MKSITRKLRPNEIAAQRKQREILFYVRTYYEKRNAFPTAAEIGLNTGFDLGTVYYHIRQLEKKHLIQRQLFPRRKGTESKLFIRSTDRSSTRLTVIQYLGGKCARCGFDDIRVLQIDHVHGNGWRERRDWGGSYQIYRRLLRRVANKEVISDYQVLCANCNWIKGFENDEFKTHNSGAEL
jgi:DNA-binding MarR family transcriptional regulator